MADYEINEFNKAIFDNGVKKQKNNPLWEEYAQLEYEFINNQHNLAKDSIKIARYNELKKYFDVKKTENALNQAKELIKQRMIAADKSPDNNVVYTAITNFKKTTNE